MCLLCIAIVGIYITVGFTIDTNSKINKYVASMPQPADENMRQSGEQEGNFHIKRSVETEAAATTAAAMESLDVDSIKRRADALYALNIAFDKIRNASAIGRVALGMLENSSSSKTSFFCANFWDFFSQCVLQSRQPPLFCLCATALAQCEKHAALCNEQERQQVQPFLDFACTDTLLDLCNKHA